MSELAVSATEQIQKQVDRSLEPKLDLLLSRKVKVNALKTKPNKREQRYKLKIITKEQFAKKEPQMRDHSVHSGTTLAKFSKQHFGVELSNDTSSDDDNIKPSGKGDSKPSGKGFVSRRGNCKPAFEPFYDCYGIDVAPMNIFENQVIPVGIHNISKKR